MRRGTRPASRVPHLPEVRPTRCGGSKRGRREDLARQASVHLGRRRISVLPAFRLGERIPQRVERVSVRVGVMRRR
jgi:hypothetical protein